MLRRLFTWFLALVSFTVLGVFSQGTAPFAHGHRGRARSWLWSPRRVGVVARHWDGA